MTDTIRVVARYLDGKILKGTTQDFFPNRPLFHLTPHEPAPSVEVKCHDLKAVFFVKDFAGDHSRRDVRGFMAAPHDTAQGKKIAVRFRDGELLCGYSLSYSNERDGFFLVPADSGSNNLRVYVVATAAAEIKAGPAAELLAKKSANAEAA